MDVVKKVKDVAQDVKKDVEVVAKNVADGFDNLVSHLPFANLAKKDSNSFHIEVDLPGVKKEDIDIKVEEGVLVVSAVRYYKNETTRDDYYICESSFGKIERRFILPENIDTDAIDAELHDGRLDIELKKVPQAQAKSITIN